MSAADVIKAATALGIKIVIQGDSLHLKAAAPPPRAILELLTQHKAEIISLLKPGHGGFNEESEPEPVSWLEMAVAVDNEARRHRFWCDELTRRAREDKLSADEREALERAIATRTHNAAIFDAISRLIERERPDLNGDGSWE